MSTTAENQDDAPSALDGSTPRNHSVYHVSEPLNEHSPLLAASDYCDEHSNVALAHDDDLQATKSVWYLILLTIGIGGLQIAWSVEISHGSPYLLSLGLSKSLMALVWIAGPLTGTLVQPYIGMLSDNCRLRMGKRKPFMLGGAAATILSLLCLAWTKEMVGGFLTLFGADPQSEGVRVTIIVVAVLWVYVLDVAVNTLQAAIRAFIVDCAPAHQQESANAMASRFLGVGNIVGYMAAYLDLPRYLWFLGKTQFQILCVVASFVLGATVGVSTAFIRERDPGSIGPPVQGRPNVLVFFFTIFKSIRRLPLRIKRVCQVQICAWIGFFPLLFYASSYIGDIYAQPYLRANPHMTPAELDALYEKATRVGSFALVINSVVCLVTSIVLPFFIVPTFDKRPVGAGAEVHPPTASKSAEQLPSSALDRLKIPGFTLRRAWFGSLVLFALVTGCTVLVRSVQAATVLISIVGITWALTQWAPYAIISAEISRRDAISRAGKTRPAVSPADDESLLPPPLNGSQNEARTSRHSDKAEGDGEEQDQAGVILGIHNMAIAAPQILANVGSSLVFKIWQKPRGTPGDHSMAIVLALGGLCVLLSSYFVIKIKESTSLTRDGSFDAERGGSARGRRIRRRVGALNQSRSSNTGGD